VNAAQFSCWIAKLTAKLWPSSPEMNSNDYSTRFIESRGIMNMSCKSAILKKSSSNWLNSSKPVTQHLKGASSALTELAGHQEEHAACKKWCRCGYLSGARYRLFAYGPADATAIPKPLHRLLPHLNPDWFSCTRGC